MLSCMRNTDGHGKDSGKRNGTVLFTLCAAKEDSAI